MENVDGVDADAWTDLAGRSSVISRHVDNHDASDDAAVRDPDAPAPS